MTGGQAGGWDGEGADPSKEGAVGPDARAELHEGEAKVQGASPCAVHADGHEPDPKAVQEPKGPPVGRAPRAAGLPEEVRRWIVDRRRADPQVGLKRIAQELREQQFLVVSRKKIREVLKAAGLLDTNDSSFHGPAEPKGTRRFEAPQPRALYQMDVTYVYVQGLSVLYLVSVVDDHSRFCVRSQLCLDQRVETLIEVLHGAVERHGRPRAVLTDQGSGFYSWSANGTVFQQYLDSLQVEHIVAEPHSPQTIGKLERFNQSLKRELFQRVRFTGYGDAAQAMDAWVYEYNYRRPHQGLGGQTGADPQTGGHAASSRSPSKT